MKLIKPSENDGFPAFHRNFYHSMILRGVLALFVAFSLCCVYPSGLAYTDVRKADILFGESIDSRGLSVAQSPNIEAEYAVVMGEDGSLYFERNSSAPAQIASITKIMTALVAMEAASSDTVVVVSYNAASVGESSASLQEGDILSFDAALKGLMLSSGNDAAIALAETVGGILSGGTAQGAEAEQIFVDRMNAKAAEMSLKDTIFRNPHGLDDGIHAGDQHSCALDVAILAQAAMQNETFRSIVSTPQSTIEVTHADGTHGILELASTDRLLGVYEGACGIKTGFTDAAGSCFAGASNRGGQDLYAIVLKSTDDDTRFSDATTLFDWVYEHTVSYPLAHSDQKISIDYLGQSMEVPIVAEVAHSDWIDKTVKAMLVDPVQTVSIFDLNGNISQTVEYGEVSGNIEIGDKLGTITFKQRNEVLITVDMVACEEVKAPDLFEGIGIWWDRFFRGFSGQATVASDILINQTPLLIDNKIGSS